MKSDAETVGQYLDELPEDRRRALEAVREIILGNLPDGYVETMNWGMISYEVPLATSGPTYNGKPLMIAALASQKNHMAVYLCGLYCVPGIKARFEAACRKSGVTPNMGASCVRFRKLGQLDMAAIAEVIGAVPPDRLIEVSSNSHRKR